MDLVSRSFRLERSSSALLRSESISNECSRIAGYERLSAGSMRMSSGRDTSHVRGGKSGAFRFISRVFSFRKASANNVVEGELDGKKHNPEEKKKRKKKRFSWLPEPDKRWPVQGW